jgi:hypothetical protein
MFEKSQGKYNNLDYQKEFGIFLLIAKFTCLKLDTNLKCF